MEYNRGYFLRTEITKRHLSNRICEQCGRENKHGDPLFLLRF